MIVTETTRAAALLAAGAENHPFVAWDNGADGATLGGTATLADGAADNAVNGTTYNYWRPDVTATTARFQVQLAAARTISCVGLVAHNLAELGASVQARHSADGVSWNDAGAGVHAPADDSAIVFRLPTSGADRAYWEIYVTGLTIGDPLAIGGIFMGDDLVIPQQFYQGYAPALTPTEVEMISNVSQGGNLLGSSVVYFGSTLSPSIEHVANGFVRGADWLAFQAAFNDGRPAFFGSRPARHPEDVHYIWRDGEPIRPYPTGPRDLMTIEFAARAYEG